MPGSTPMGKFLGVVDFGIGGLGVYQQIKLLADIPVLYFSDSGHERPYGETEPAALRMRMDRIFNFLFDQGAGEVVIACNAASAVYEDTDQVSGIIGDGVAALSRGGWKTVGLIAGRGTVETGAYAKRLTNLPITLTQRIAQPLSAHIEAGRLDGPELHADLNEIVTPLAGNEAVVLACTHYPAIASQIRQYVGADCVLVDPAVEMARRVVGSWDGAAGPGNATGTVSSADRFYTSGNQVQFKTFGGRAFDLDLPLLDQSPV